MIPFIRFSPLSPREIPASVAANIPHHSFLGFDDHGHLIVGVLSLHLPVQVVGHHQIVFGVESPGHLRQYLFAGSGKVITELFMPMLLKIRLNSSSPARVSRVAAMLMVYIPAPTANPMPAVAHIPAAVVSPLTICFWK